MERQDHPNLTGHVALVTGASAGLGRRAATVLAQTGAKVVAVARRADALATIEGATPLPWDLSDRDGLADLADAAASPHGAPDILVHAAGINTRQPADEVTFDGWDISLGLNLAAPFFLSQHLVPAMKAKGWGRIVNFASLQSARAFPGGLAYGASKGRRGAADPRHGRGLVAPRHLRQRHWARIFPDRADRRRLC